MFGLIIYVRMISQFIIKLKLNTFVNRYSNLLNNVIQLKPIKLDQLFVCYFIVKISKT